MILAIDVHYKESYAKAVGVLFNWEDESPKEIISIDIDTVEGYVPGEFYKRELPCIIKIIEQIDLEDIECIIVDGHTYINNNKEVGLGGHLYYFLNEKTPIIGVAKKAFINTEQVSFPLLRGESKNPLYVSSVGIDVKLCLKKIREMKGAYRIPTILKQLDQLTKKDEA